LICLENITKCYDGTAAVEGLDLAISRGSVFGLIGPNGAGKTTTLKILATLIKPDAGTVRIGGRDIEERVAEVRRSLGYMADRQGNFRGLNAEEYLGYFGRLSGLGGAALASRIGDVLELTDLRSVRDERVSALSMGMRQRLALAKTLLHDPDLLILDEPASGLDPRARIEIRALLKELGRMGKTIVISSHILADLEDICTAIGIMEKGRLIMSGALADLRKAASAGRRSVRVRVAAADAARALAALEAAAGIVALEPVAGPEAGEIRADLDGVSGNRVLAALIERDIEVLSFIEERTTLEAIFIDRTVGAVQ
jgi:ABC-2 type transport system ATP-binding protein